MIDDRDDEHDDRSDVVAEASWAGGLVTLIGNDNPDPHGEFAAHPFGLGAGLVEYASGVLVPSPSTMGFEADAYPPDPTPHPIPLDVFGITQRPYQIPHEATHRRYEPPRVITVNQAAAGYTLISSPNQGLHYIKVLAACLTLDAAGTLQWLQGGLQTSADPALTGAINIGGAAAAQLMLPPAPPENPWLFTAPDQSLGILTVTGKAQGWVVVCYSPFDS